MTKVVRFGVSIEENLARRFDEHIRGEGYSNRSEALRDLIREHLAEERLSHDRTPAVASLSLVYDNHQHNLQETLNQLEHEYSQLVVSSLHIHIDHDNCLEVVIMKGPNCWIKKVADRLVATRGVKHGKLTMTTTG
ncbi:MAG TPA: nickel-responsive transcriptional regulator NikR [Candidatus Glassbacteria bacterium]|nr:nickel-responsive transcriptional regulator NikR [Candidatus Glassbacteria bacterium]